MEEYDKTCRNCANCMVKERGLVCFLTDELVEEDDSCHRWEDEQGEE